MLKNATFKDLFLAQASKNIDKRYISKKILQTGAINHPKILAIKVKIKPIVKVAGKK
jgi:hypothetical protein